MWILDISFELFLHKIYKSYTLNLSDLINKNMKKKKILFILNTYSFMTYLTNKSWTISKNYKIFNSEDKSWVNYFYNNLKKDYSVEKDYPNINKFLLGNNKYLNETEKKINRFKPDLLFVSIDDPQITNLMKKYQNIKKIIWISYKINEKKIKELKKSYSFLMSDNNLILKLAKQNKLPTLKFLSSNENLIELKEKNYQKRNHKLYFAGSLGNDFTYRLENLLFLNKNFDLKIRVRNLAERYRVLNFLNKIFLYILPNFSKYLFKKKILPISNQLKYVNDDEIFGKTMLNELKKYKFCINIHSDFDKNNAINSRVFEALACGCLLFTDKNKFMNKFFKGGKHVIYFNSKNDLKKKINYYSINKDAAYKIAKSGNLLFNKKHQSKVRIKEFKKIIKGIKV